ncbi:MAG TPA: hypothetical protein VGD53_00790 [Actinoallomurus sp.]
MLKKTCVASGMLIATAAGAILTSVPAFAGVPTWGGGGCCASSHSRFGHFSHNRSWNGSENEGLNHIRLRIHNRNNNIATARTGRDRGGDDGLGIGAPGGTG